jgi:hypothetical protein
MRKTSNTPGRLIARPFGVALGTFWDVERMNPGGKGEIRTHGTPKGTLDFESSAFDHSATFPSTGA